MAIWTYRRATEIQAFDGNHRFVFRLNLAEPLWPAVRDRLRDTPLLPESSRGSCSDQIIDETGMEALLVTLEPLLIQYRDRSLSRGRRGTFRKIAVVVSGTQLWLDPRSSEDVELQRLNALVVAIRETAKSAPPLHALVMPNLDAIAFRLATILRNDVTEATRDDLRSLLRQRLDELHSSADHEDVRKSRARDIELARSQAAVDDTVAFLAQWRLIDESPTGAISAADKLRHILI
ncbi:hypothetical protein [Micromonospora sp. DT31]|uniref:hypothetical protein n=2 Tax=Micromonospora TaxID=1873 RepID=UPI003CECB354